MFSIEATLEELIKFVKKFFATLTQTFLFPRRLMTANYSDTLLKPSHYLLICMLIFFSLQSLNSWYVHGIELNKTLKSYLSSYESSAVESNLLYIIPIAIGVWALVTIAGKILKLNSPTLVIFKSYLFCWIGNSLLLNTIYIAAKVISPNVSITVDAKPDPMFEIIGNALYVAYYLVWFGPIAVTVLALVFNFKKMAGLLWLKFLMIPLVLWIGINFCFRGSQMINSFFEDKHELLQAFSGDGSDHLFFLSGFKDNPKVDTVRLEMEVVIRNNTSADVYFSEEDYFDLYAGNDSEDMNDPSVSLSIKEIDGTLPKRITILKAGESKAMLFSGKKNSKEWTHWLKVAGASKGGWCKANYYLNIHSPDLHNVAAGGDIMVDYTLRNMPIEKDKK